MQFNTLYYDISIKVYIKNVKVYKTLRLKNIRLDYEDKDIIKKESLFSIFNSQISIICERYSVTVDDIVIKKYDVNNLNTDIKYTVIDDVLYIHRETVDITNLDVYITTLSNVVLIDIKNFKDYITYTATINDGSKITKISIHDNITYYSCINNNIKIDITASHNNVVIDRYIKEIILNNKYINKSIVSNKSLDTNNKDYDVTLFQNGLEYSKNKPYITQVNDNQEFNIKAMFKSIVEEDIFIYPKVMINYKNTLNYQYDIDRICGNAKYSASINQDGNIKAKLVKYYAPSLKVTFNVSCTITYYHKQNNNIYTYTSRNITVQKQHTVDMNNFVYIDDSKKTVMLNETGYIDVPDHTSLYTIMYNQAKTDLGDITGATLHGFNISNIKYFNGSSEITGRGEFIYPLFHKSDDNKIDTSKPIKYIIRPSYIYSYETIVDFTVGESEKIILDQSSYSTLKNEFGDSYTNSSGVKYKIYVLSNNDSVIYNLTDGVLKAKSYKPYSITRNYILNDQNHSKTVELRNELGVAIDNKTYSGSITVTCTGKPIRFMSEMLTNGQSKTININGSIDNFVVGFTGTTEKVTLSATETLPKNGTYLASVNGNAITYETNLKGKEDFISKDEPFLIPGNAKNITFGCDIVSVSPSKAQVTKHITESTDTSQYCFILRFSSNYIDKKTINVNRYVGEHSYTGFIMPSNYEMLKSIELVKPSTQLSYIVDIESNNPNLIFEYTKHVTFESDKINLDILCKTSKHPANKWEINIPKSYMYIDNQEYYTFTNCIHNANVIDNMIIFNSKIQSQEPICLYNPMSDLSLNRVLSTEDDGISIKERISSENNIFYTIYNNIEILSVCDIYGNNINYSSGDNYIIPYEKYETILVIYKVCDSFDFVTSNDETKLYINSNTKSFDIHYNKNKDIKTQISLNPVHNMINKGYIYYSNSNSKLGNAVAYRNSFSDNHTIIVEVKDLYGNPYVSSNVNISNVTGTIVNRFTNTDINGVFKYIIKNDNYHGSEIITIDGIDIKVGELF